MTTAAPTPAFETAPDMAHAPNTAPQAPTAQAPPTQTGTTAAARPTLRAQIADNPLLSFLGALIVVLLAAAIASPNIRISDTNARIDRLEDTMEARFAAQDAKIDRLDAKIDRLDAKIDEMNLKLTALIAALQMTGIVEATLDGRLTDPGTNGSDGTNTDSAGIGNTAEGP